jgi:FdhE protein
MPGADTQALFDQRLAQLRAAHPELESAIDLQARLARQALTSARDPLVEAFPLPRARVVAKVRSGTPLLHGEPAVVDVHYAADLFGRLVDVVADAPDPELGQRVGALVAAATGGRLDPERLFTEALVQHPDHLAELAVAGGVDPDLLSTLAGLSVAPLLRAYASHLLPLLDQADDGSPDGAIWERGYCPICGGWPLLGELRGLDQAQFSRCAACGSGWRSRRLACQYCGTDDHRQLHRLQVEGERRFHVLVCDACRGYLPVGNAFDPLPAELLVLDDLASIHLAIAAIERGYARPFGSGFHLELATEEVEWAEELASLD